jgi:hypothetical protein
MLTKQDLSQIKKAVRDEVTTEAKTTRINLRAEIKLSRIEIQNDLNDLTDRAKNLEQQTDETHKTVKKIDKKLDKFIDYFDQGNLALEKRTKRIEAHLQLPPLADF